MTRRGHAIISNNTGLRKIVVNSHPPFFQASVKSLRGLKQHCLSATLSAFLFSLVSLSIEFRSIMPNHRMDYLDFGLLNSKKTQITCMLILELVYVLVFG